MNLVRMFEMIVPFIVGIVFGAVLVAREIEQGTAPLSWALAGSRTRWLLGKLLAVVVLIVPLLLIAGLAADVRQGALVPGGSDSHA
jgi:ABC-type transport system involved in multi-copper enzyme maturation permease subunit